jgi:multisubunit Na+/H+ antiporter MnhG subunit
VLTTRVLGFVGAAIVLFVFRAKDGSGFNVTRSDIIILVLANVAVSGALIWLITRDRLDWRIGILAFLFALRLTQNLPGWGQWLWNVSPAPWIGTVYFQQYLFIIIPGTIAGDLILKWMQRGATNTPIAPYRFDWPLILLGAAMTIILVVGMKSRDVIATTIAALLASAIGILMLNDMLKRAPAETKARVAALRSLFLWGVFWLALGLAFEPFEGGIKKDKATMSYYFVTSGLAAMLLVSFMLLFDVRRITRGFALVIATGQNPLVAYAGVQSLLPPLLAFSGLGNWIASFTATPWLGAMRGALYTWLIALFGAWCTKRGWFLKT